MNDSKASDRRTLLIGSNQVPQSITRYRGFSTVTDASASDDRDLVNAPIAGSRQILLGVYKGIYFHEQQGFDKSSPV